MFVFTKINYLESNTPKKIYLFPILYFASVSPIAEQALKSETSLKLTEDP